MVQRAWVLELLGLRVCLGLQIPHLCVRWYLAFVEQGKLDYLMVKI